MNMIKTMTAKSIRSTIILLLFLWGLGGFALWHYAPDTLRLLQGTVKPEYLEENVSNYYGMSALSLIFLLLGLFILIKQFASPVKKRVDKYLAEHPELNLQMLDDDFMAAKKFGDIWVGRKFTFVADLNRVFLENDKIVWIYKDMEYKKNASSYYICWCMADGKEYRSRLSERNQRLLHEYYSTFPHILTEYNQNYKKLFKHNMNELLSIKYNQHIQQ